MNLKSVFTVSFNFNWRFKQAPSVRGIRYEIIVKRARRTQISRVPRTAHRDENDANLLEFHQITKKKRCDYIKDIQVITEWVLNIFGKKIFREFF